jgi:ABC-type polar amino acid transport system ATPase subunit
MPDQDYMIEVREISKRFDSLEVLRKISLNVRPGEVFVVVGPRRGQEHLAALSLPSGDAR